MTVADLKKKISSLPDEAIIIDGISCDEVIIELDKEVMVKESKRFVKIACGYADGGI